MQRKNVQSEIILSLSVILCAAAVALGKKKEF